MTTIPALTVRQPWTWAIAKGYKPIENRTRSTSYRGPLAIHSGLKWDDDGEYALKQVVDLARAQGSVLPKNLAKDLPYSGLGLVLAVVDLVGVCTAAQCGCGPWARPGQAHWQLANARLLPEPFKARGALYLFDVDVPDSVLTTSGASS